MACKSFTMSVSMGAGVAPLPKLPARAARRPSLACRAQQQGGNGGSRRTDWDAAWARYQKVRASGAASAGTKVPSGSPRVDPNQKLVLDSIRRQESVLLNLWSSAGFQGGMVFVALFVLVAFVFTAGPPPVDDRCTLPWC